MNQLKDKFLASGEMVLNAHLVELTALGAFSGQLVLDILRRNPVNPDILINQYLPVSFCVATTIGFLGMLYLTTKNRK